MWATMIYKNGKELKNLFKMKFFHWVGKLDSKDADYGLTLWIRDS
jgi:hypothetical protein